MESKTWILTQDQLPDTLVLLTAEAQRTVSVRGIQTFGRETARETPDIPVSSRAVSRKHGRFGLQPDGLRYEDLGSTNGTTWNGTRLDPLSPCQLSAGDVLRIHGAEDRDRVMDVLLVACADGGADRQWQRIELRDDMAEIAVGREQGLALHAPGVSRRHASFFRASGGWAVIDHGSTNGVLLNGNRLEVPAYLHPMDVVSISGCLFLFTGSRLIYSVCPCEGPKAESVDAFPEPAVEEKTISELPEYAPASDPACPAAFRETVKCQASGSLSVWIEERNVWHRAKKKTLLRDIDLEIDSGSMVLVLGGSGAGKTTFMNAVMGYEKADGEIRYNGVDIYDEYERMKYEIGYVPQQDLLRMNDTVWDTLLNAARMRLPRGLKDYEERVRQTAEMLGLSRELDSLVGKLSGGQRKRLSIAVEYIGGPSLFFLDEPDSGLDGTMARALMENLRTIADRGKIVMVISHAPDRAFELFDRVLVLAKDSRENCGRMAFFGTPEEACRFFEVDSLEHIVRRINRPDEGGDGMADHYIDRFERWGNIDG